MNRLQEIIKNSIVTEFGKRTIQFRRSRSSVSGIDAMTCLIRLTPTKRLEGLGVELVDFRVKQVEFVSEVT